MERDPFGKLNSILVNCKNNFVRGEVRRSTFVNCFRLTTQKRYEDAFHYLTLLICFRSSTSDKNIQTRKRFEKKNFVFPFEQR